MNIIVSALQHDDFASQIVKERPTMLQFFHLALAGHFENFHPDLLNMLRLSEGVTRIGDLRLASEAMFVVFPVGEWDPSPVSVTSATETFGGTWTHVQRYGDEVIIVPDDGDMAKYNIALFLQREFGENGTELVPVQYRPHDLSVEVTGSPCAEGYVTIGNRRRGTCFNNGCQGRCKLKASIEKKFLTYKCGCS